MVLKELGLKPFVPNAIAKEIDDVFEVKALVLSKETLTEFESQLGQHQRKRIGKYPHMKVRVESAFNSKIDQDQVLDPGQVLGSSNDSFS